MRSWEQKNVDKQDQRAGARHEYLVVAVAACVGNCEGATAPEIVVGLGRGRSH